MSFPQYERHKNTGIGWLLTVPEYWEVLKLKRVVDLIESGTSVNAVDDPATDGAAGVLKTSCVYSGQFDVTENKRVLEEEISRVSCPLKPNTLIVSRMNTPDLVGAAGLVNTSRGNIYLPDRLWQVHFIHASPAFVHYWTQSTFYRMQVRAACGGTSSSMQNLAQDQFGSFIFVSPPINEQDQIVTFLNRETAKIDALVTEQQRLIKLLTEKRQAVICHAVTKGLNPGAPMKDSSIESLGEVPAHWNVRRLKFIANVQSGVAKGKEIFGVKTVNVPYLRVANVQDGYLDLEDVAVIEIAESDLSHYLLRAGDVLMNEGGDYDKLGRGYIWREQVAPCIHQNHVFAVRPHAVSSEWLNEITGSAYAQHYFMTRSKQSTNLASISSTNLMELPVVLPPESEQYAILAFLDKQRNRLDTLTAEARTAITLLQERRTALISAAVTGKIDIRGLVTADHKEEVFA